MILNFTGIMANGQDIFFKMDRTLLPLIMLYMMVGIKAMCPDNCACTSYDEVVDCSNLELESVPADIQSNVTQINLAGNKITALSEVQFSKFFRLFSLDLSNNSIGLIAPSAFQGLETSFSQLLLAGNQLQEIAMGTFNDSKRLSLLDLNFNKISRLNPSLFYQCTSLSQLRLRGNRLKPSIFETLELVPWLQTLDLSQNPLSNIPYLAMGKMYSLSYIQMVECDIATIDTNAFVGLTSLEFLNLDQNKVSLVRREIFQPLDNLVEVSLRSNPITCTCGTKQFRDWLEDNRITFDRSTTCVPPNGLTGISILDGDLSGLCAPDQSTTTPSLPPEPCSNHTQVLTMETVNSSTIAIHWNKESFRPGQLLQIAARLFSSESSFYEGFVPANFEMVLLSLPLRAQTGLVVCLVSATCDNCQEFVITPTSDGTNFIVVAVVSSVLGVCVVILLALLIWTLVLIRRRKKAMQSKAIDQKDQIAAGAEHNAKRDTEGNIGQGEHPYEAIPADQMDPRRSAYLIQNGHPVAFTNKGYIGEGLQGSLAPGDHKRPLGPDQYIHPIATIPRERRPSRPTTTELLDATRFHQPTPPSQPRRPSEHKYEEPITISRPKTADYEQPIPRHLQQQDDGIAKSLPALDSLDTVIPIQPHYMALGLGDGSSDDRMNEQSEYYNRDPMGLYRYSGHSNLHVVGDKEGTGSDYLASDYLRMSSRTPSEYMDMNSGSPC